MMTQNWPALILRHAQCTWRSMFWSLPPPRTKASLNTSKNNSWHLPGLQMPGSSYHSRVQQALHVGASTVIKEYRKIFIYVLLQISPSWACRLGASTPLLHLQLDTYKQCEGMPNIHSTLQNHTPLGMKRAWCLRRMALHTKVCAEYTITFHWPLGIFIFNTLNSQVTPA